VIVVEGHMSGTREARRVALESWNVNEACIGAGRAVKGWHGRTNQTQAGDPSNLLPSLCESPNSKNGAFSFRSTAHERLFKQWKGVVPATLDAH